MEYHYHAPPHSRIPDERDDLVRGFADVINLHCAENSSNTPDFILAEYLVACLESFEAASNRRVDWYESIPDNPRSTLLNTASETVKAFCGPLLSDHFWMNVVGEDPYCEYCPTLLKDMADKSVYDNVSCGDSLEDHVWRGDGHDDPYCMHCLWPYEAIVKVKLDEAIDGFERAITKYHAVFPEKALEILDNAIEKSRKG